MIIKRSIIIKKHSTSISLENPFWICLNEIASSRKMSLASLVGEIDERRSTQPKLGLSSAVRIFVLEYYKN